MARGLPGALAEEAEGLLRRLDALRFDEKQAKEVSETVRQAALDLAERMAREAGS
jgi:hypothetical protein